MKFYNQQAANLNGSDQNIEFTFGENINYHQTGNAYLQYEITVEKVVAIAADKVLVDGEVSSLVNKTPLNFVLKEIDYLPRVVPILNMKNSADKVQLLWEL